MTFLTIVNNAYRDFAEYTISRWQMGNLIVKCIDKEIYNSLKPYESNAINLHPPIKAKDNEHAFGSKTFNELCHMKWRSVIDTLKTFDQLYYFDIDVFFLADIRQQATDMLARFDIVFQQDSPLAHWPEGGGNYVCAGNFCANNNERTMKLLNDVEAKLKPGRNDQETLFYHLEEYGKRIYNYPHCNIGEFPRTEWQNGFDAFRADVPLYKTAKVVHINHMTGIGIKREKLQLIKSI